MTSMKTPSYRRHKATGQAVVTLNGRDVYLGKYGSAASKKTYRRIIGEWLQRGGILDMSVEADPAIVEICTAYWKHAREYYRGPNGKPTRSIGRTKLALRHLRTLYGDLPARKFGPLALQNVRQQFIDAGLSRPYCNYLTNEIQRAFRWAASQELIPIEVYQGLKSVAGLRKGRTVAPEPKPIPPVADAVVEATLPHLPPTIADMVRVQRLTGCRPGEIVIMRPIDIDRTGEVWVYRPAVHKLSWRGKDRSIVLGPKCQSIITAYLDRPEEEYCFAPTESEKLRHIDMRRKRKSKVQPSQVSRKKKNPKRKPGDHYTPGTYARRIRDVCVREKIPHWTPNQLRKAAAVQIRETFDLEGARAVLGHHESTTTSQFYAVEDVRRAAEIAKQIG